MCSKIRSNWLSGFLLKKSPKRKSIFSPLFVASFCAIGMELGAISSPVTFHPALANALASCPRPQPGTRARPRGILLLDDDRKSTSPGEASPWSQEISLA